MKFNCLFCFTLALLGALSFVANPVRAFEDGYGSISGQYVLDGDNVPARKFLVAKGANVKDPAVCAANAVPADDLVIDPKTKGIRDIFVYVTRVDKIHPDLLKSNKAEVVFDQKGCRFFPHSLVLRTDQTVLVKSDDACAHNTHTYPFRNDPKNFLLSPNDRKGVELKNPTSERLPFQVKCDIHPWMKAHWLVLDHPYAAVTNEKGQFTIEKIPVGDYKFRVWHERVGYVGSTSRRGFDVSVTSGKNPPRETVKVPLKKFEE